MAASISKPRRLVNPGRRRRKNASKRMTLKQKLHFGTKAQRAAARRSLRGKRSNAGKRSVRKSVKAMKVAGFSKKTTSAYRRQFKRLKRRKNIGEILTVFNPSRKGKNSMARRRKRTRRVVAHRRRRRSNPIVRRHRRRRSAPVMHRRRRRSNPSYSRRRRHNARRGRSYRRRNPGFMSGTVGQVVGVIAGASVTSLIMNQVSNYFSMVSSGIPKYIAGAVVAFLQGKLIGKVAKAPGFGRDMQVGGYTYVALQVLNDFLPQLPLGLHGMGLITSNNSFGAPYVPIPGSMTSFVRPAGVPAPYVPPASGIRGLGRMSQRRVGRMA